MQKVLSVLLVIAAVCALALGLWKSPQFHAYRASTFGTGSTVMTGTLSTGEQNVITTGTVVVDKDGLSDEDQRYIREQGLSYILQRKRDENDQRVNTGYDQLDALTAQETDLHKKLIMSYILSYAGQGVGGSEASQVNSTVYAVRVDEGNDTVSQQVIDLSGNIQEMADLGIKIPDSVIFGNIVFTSPEINFTGGRGGLKFDGGGNSSILPIAMDNAYQSIDSALQENKTIANNILVQTQVNNNRLLIKYSVLFPFDTNILKPTNSKMFGGGFTIVENKTYHLNSNAKVPTLITDLTQSKHILTNYFTGLVTLGTGEFDNNGMPLQSITQSLMPMFGYYPIDEEYSMLYIAHPLYHVFEPMGLGR